MTDTKTRIRRRRRKIAFHRRKGIVSKLRAPITILTICLITGIIGYIGVSDGSVSDSGLAISVYAEEKVVYKDVVIKSGDTIWGIASVYAEPSKDIRKLIKEICKLNDIKPGNIYPGQVIKVPVPAYLDL